MCVAFAPDGKTLVTGTYGGDRTARLWDVATGKELRRFDADQSAYGVESIAISPDGKMLATGGRSDQVVLWELGTGKEIREIPSHGGNIIGVAFSPDGKTLAFGGCTDKQIHLWDIANEKETRAFQVDRQRLLSMAMAPDGKTLLSGGDGPLGLWDVSTGQAIREIPQKFWAVGSVAFSPDGKMMAAGNWHATVDLYEAATGKHLAVMTGHRSKVPGFVGVMGVAFSPDGRTVASVAEDATVRIWEVLSGEERLCLKGHDDATTAVCFAPDGRTLVSGSTDGSAILWDVSLTGGQSTVARIDPKDLQARWDLLAGDEASDAFRAMGELARSPRETVPFFKERFQEETSNHPERITRLIAQLDSDDFEERERASAALEQLGATAADALQQALTGQPSLEVRRRAESLLKKLGTAAARAPRYQWLRAVEVLEQIGTAEARALLESLAQGATRSTANRGSEGGPGSSPQVTGSPFMGPT